MIVARDHGADGGRGVAVEVGFDGDAWDDDSRFITTKKMTEKSKSQRRQ